MGSRPNGAAGPVHATYTFVKTDLFITVHNSVAAPAKPLEQYTVEDIRREYITEKSCAPLCTVSCVHQISYFDFFRGEQTLSISPEPQRQDELVTIKSAGA